MSHRVVMTLSILYGFKSSGYLPSWSPLSPPDQGGGHRKLQYEMVHVVIRPTDIWQRIYLKGDEISWMSDTSYIWLVGVCVYVYVSHCTHVWSRTRLGVPCFGLVVSSFFSTFQWRTSSNGTNKYQKRT